MDDPLPHERVAVVRHMVTDALALYESITENTPVGEIVQRCREAQAILEQAARMSGFVAAEIEYIIDEILRAQREARDADAEE